MQANRFLKKYFPEVTSFLFILLFVYAALAKLMEFEKFQVQLGQSPLITSFSGFVAFFIPALEIFISVLLAIPKFRLTGLYASFGLMVLFAGYIVAVTRFSSYVPCSCGGVLQKLSWNQHLIFNIAFVLLAFTGVLYQSENNHPKPVSG